MKNMLIILILIISFSQTNAQVVQGGMPQADSFVYSIVRQGDIVFVGGAFSTFGGLTRNHLAAFDANTGIVLPWSPDPNGNVNCLLVADGKLVVGGEFTNIASANHNYLAVFDLTNFNMSSNSPLPNYFVYNLKLYGNMVYFNEHTLSLNHVIKRFNLNTGIIDTWHTDTINSSRFALAFDIFKNFIYVGGEGFTIKNNIYYCLARFNINTGYVDTSKIYTFSNSADNVKRILTFNNKLYVAGDFRNINSLTRFGVFELDTLGNITTLDFHCSNHQNYSIFGQGNTLWIGGNSANIGSGYSLRLAQVDLSNGYATCWSVNSTLGSHNYVGALFVQADTVYAGMPDLGPFADPFKVFIGNPSYVNLGPDIFINQGGSAIISTNVPFQNYLWNNGSTTSSITVNSPGKYWVDVSTLSGCSATDTIEVNYATGINQNQFEGNYYLFPNPVSIYSKIHFPINRGSIYEIIDLDGKQKRTGKLEQQDQEINFFEIENGIYVLKIYDNQHLLLKSLRTIVMK